jgi:hypothetical protein
MGIELEWFSLFFLHVLGSSIFGVFEVETPAWRLALKWTIVAATTLGVYQLAGHWALLVMAVPAAAGTIFHFTWCRKNGIDPLKATPRRKYYELRGWKWVE